MVKRAALLLSVAACWAPDYVGSKCDRTADCFEGLVCEVATHTCVRSGGSGGGAAGGAAGGAMAGGGSAGGGSAGGGSAGGGSAGGGSAGGGSAGGGSAGGGSDAGTPVGACASSGWCWENPLPFGASLSDVYTSSPSDVWAVGSGGFVARFDGGQWQVTQLGTSSIAAIDGTGPNDVYAVGNGILAHWNGTAWTSSIQPVLFNSVIAFSPASAVALDSMGSLHVWDGGSWSSGAGSLANPAKSAWGTSLNDLWGVTTAGEAAHWNGSAWNSPTVIFPTAVNAVHGSSSTSLWAVGQGNAARYDGAWQAPVSIPNMNDVWTLSASDAWAVGPGDLPYHWDGGSWGPGSAVAPSGITLTAVAFSSSTDGWAAGNSGWLRHFDGTTWTPLSPTPACVGNSCGGADRRTPNFAGGFAASPDDAWAVGPPTALWHWDGAAWSIDTRVPSGSALKGAWGTSRADVFAVGVNGALLHFDGGSWGSMPGTWSAVNFNAVHGTSTTDVWAVGGNGLSGALALHWDGGTWTDRQVSGSYELTAVAAAAPNDVWAVGTSGLMRHWTGSSWQSFTPPSGWTSSNFSAVWAAATDAVWAAASGSAPSDQLLFYDGGGWSAVPAPGAGPNVTAIWGTAANDVWVAQFPPAVLHYDGSSWTKTAISGAGTLTAVFGSGATNVWVVGSAGTILRHRP